MVCETVAGVSVALILMLVVDGVFIHNVQIIDKWDYLNLSDCMYRKVNLERVWEHRNEHRGDVEIIFIGCI